MPHRYARDKARPITSSVACCPFTKPLGISTLQLSQRPLTNLVLAILVALLLLPYAAGAAAPASGQTTGQAQWLQPENQPRVTEAGHAKIAEQLTARLPGLLTAYNKASENAKANALNDLIAVAEERHALLTSLIDDDPGTVLRVAIPAKVRNSMPAAVRPFLERNLDLEGELTVLYEDYEDGSARLRHFLSDHNERISLHFKDNPPELISGKKVAANGVYLDLDGDLEADGAIVLESGEQVLTLAADGGSDGGSNGGTLAPLQNTFGEQRTLVLLVNFPDKTTEPWSVEEAHDIIFGAVNDYYQENSYGQTSLSGDVFGWFTIPVDVSTCDTISIEWEARQAAASAGIDVWAYDRWIFAFPGNICSWSGMGTVGGTPSKMWLDGALGDVATVEHELGHNFGLFHSRALECGTEVAEGNCSSIEYGDIVDIMGSRSGGHFNTQQKMRLGWLDFDASPSVTTVDTSGIYNIEPYALSSNGDKALRILRDIDPSTGERSWYYVEFRQAIGFDSVFSDNTNLLNGVVVHAGSESEPQNSYLLDMTPASSSTFDWSDPALSAGQSYNDSGAGVTITPQWVDGETASISVELGQSSCMHATPDFAFLPVESPWVTSGTSVTYDLMLTNNDATACPDATFDLTAQIPDGWSGNFASSAHTLAPGASVMTSITITSANSAADGFYDFSVTATHAAGSAYRASAAATYVVSTNNDPVNTAPVAENDSAVLLEISPIIIDVLANDFDPDGDPLTVTSVSQGRKGTVASTSGGNITYTPGKRFKDSDSFTYDVTDGRETVTATVSVSLASSGNDGGGTGNGKGNKNR